MTFVTTRNFASTAAAGSDWRSVTRKLLEVLEPLRQRDEPFNLGFLYVSDHLAADTANILSLMRSVTGIENWVGAVGLGVCSCGEDYVDTPAASVLVGTFPEDSFRVFPVTEVALPGAREILGPWLDHNEALLSLVHGDPLADQDPLRIIAALEHLTGGFIAGGLSASRSEHVIIADQAASGGVGGVVFSADIPVMSALSQGCAPIGPAHMITKAEGNVIMELDGQPAFAVFTHDLKSMALTRAGEEPDSARIHEILIDEDAPELHEDVARLFKGEIHIAFPVTGSDRNDYLVRNLLGVDAESGWLAVPQTVHTGASVMFVHRDDETVRNDLIRTLLELRDRVIREQGRFAPQGGIYISCVARAMTDFSAGTDDMGGHSPAPGGEMALIRSILGDIPLAGFYANGEISNQRLYGYTGVLILFL